MKNSAALLSLLVLFSCAKARKLPEDTLAKQGGSQSVVETQNKGLLSTPIYHTNRLTINSAEEGVLKLTGTEAKAIFESLKISKFTFKEDANEKTFKSRISKNGMYVFCNEITKFEKADSPEILCTLNLNPGSGTIKKNYKDGFEPLNDANVIPNFGRVKGVEIDDKYISINIKGKDAIALFDAMNLKEEVVTDEKNNTTIRSKGEHPFLRCQESVNDEDVVYSCSLSLKVSNGDFPLKDEFAKDKAPKKEEKKEEAKEEKKEEKKEEITHVVAEAPSIKDVEAKPNP